MHVTTLLKQILDLKGVVGRGVSVSRREVLVDLKLTRRKPAGPKCKYSTRSRYDTETVDYLWRHLDMGVRGTWLFCPLSRLKCPSHGVIAGSSQTALPPFQLVGLSGPPSESDLASLNAFSPPQSHFSGTTDEPNSLVHVE